METGRHGEVDIRIEPAVLVGVRLGDDDAAADASMEELRALAETAGVRVVGVLEQRRAAPRGKTYIGKGKVDELAAMCRELGARVVIFDNELAPSQVAELEESVSVKVIDRSELILDIFANRATTRQAQLQVEIAQLEYTAPRLRAMWSHLGQVTGGAPVGVGTRGPGEQQLEIDRRIVKAKLDKLRRELREIEARRTREVHKRREEHFTAALVGYTNAGKSSLFNRLTRGGAFAADKLFATLGTRVEEWNLGGGNAAMLSDTVGFVQRLPHHLVASFRATLEDAIASHVVLVVLDVSDPAAGMQYETVSSVLDEIGAVGQPRLLLLNKVDRLPPGERDAVVARWAEQVPGAIGVSAVTGDGLDGLAEVVLRQMKGDVRECTLSIPLGDGRTVDFVEKRVAVLDRQWVDGRVDLRVSIGRRQMEQLLAGGGRMLVDGHPPHDGFRALWPASEAPKAGRARPHDTYAVGPDAD